MADLVARGRRQAIRERRRPRRTRPRASRTARRSRSSDRPGCGKTTILRLIAGFEDPDAGSIAIGGTVVAWSGLGACRIGAGSATCPRTAALFPHLSVGENVTFGLRGSDGRAARQRELLELVSLDPALAARRPDQLSGGQQQRVALARALAIEPRLMLLDEPFSALDADLRAETRHAVRRVLDTTGITTIVVTHDPDDALDFASVVAVMDAGRIARTGSPAEIYDVRRGPRQPSRRQGSLSDTPAIRAAKVGRPGTRTPVDEHRRRRRGRRRGRPAARTGGRRVWTTPRLMPRAEV